VPSSREPNTPRQGPQAGQWFPWSDGGSVSEHAWLSITYHPSSSEADWNVPCTNSAGPRLPAVTREQSAPGQAGEAIPAVMQRKLRTAELSAAAHDGDAHPARLTAVATTESLGSRDATPGDHVTTSPRRFVYLVVMKGHFAVRTLGPNRHRIVTGRYLTLTLSPETLQTIDAGISNQAPPTAIGNLGPVSNLLSMHG
jgi:hypothetical protein